MVENLLPVLTILMVDILLSGDNALVIALASRDLPPKHKKMATLLGTFGAVSLRILFASIAVYLLQIPYLKVIGGLLLIWIAIKLVAEDDESENESEIEAKSHLWGAVKTIVIADAVMSLDNVVAIAGVAKGNIWLIVFGLAVSVPIIIWGSSLVSLLMKKFPITIVIGAAILGWTAGDMIITDARIKPIFDFPWVHWVVPGICAAIIVLIGLMISRKKQEKIA